MENQQHVSGRSLYTIPNHTRPALLNSSILQCLQEDAAQSGHIDEFTLLVAKAGIQIPVGGVAVPGENRADSVSACATAVLFGGTCRSATSREFQKSA